MASNRGGRLDVAMSAHPKKFVGDVVEVVAVILAGLCALFAGITIPGDALNLSAQVWKWCFLALAVLGPAVLVVRLAARSRRWGAIYAIAALTALAGWVASGAHVVQVIS